MARDGYKRKRGGRHWRYSARASQYFLQCRKCATYLNPKCFERDENRVLALHCKTCTWAVNRQQPLKLVMKQKSKTESKSKLSLEGVLLRARKELRDWEATCVSAADVLYCRSCGEPQKHHKYEHSTAKGHFYRDCAGCRTKHRAHGEDASPLETAYRTLYPDLISYGPKVTGYEILTNPMLYPGPTYFHLTTAERDAAVALCQTLLKAA